MTGPRSLPSVGRLLGHPALQPLLGSVARPYVVALLRRVLDDHRRDLLAGGSPPESDLLVNDVLKRAALWALAPQPVINASGVILHTNLGRAPLSESAVAAVAAAAAYSNLELDLHEGGRGSRLDHVRALLITLTGAEHAHVATNNAAGVLLALTALARGKEVIVSRGHAVEIGGGFRVPTILRQSGARLVEVGTTNRTRLSDYEEAIGPRTAAILRVHSSNFRMIGFTEEVPLADLSRLTRARDLILIDDNGSGPLLDTSEFGLAHEPTPIESIQAGVDVVGFSGDKLLGGPQAGILIGREHVIAAIARHPLARATRPDKLVLAALSATLLAYLSGTAVHSLPVWRMIATTGEEVKRRAERWKEAAKSRHLEVTLVPGESTVGGGSLPGSSLPTTLVVLPRDLRASTLRGNDPPVIARTHAGRVVIDLRTVPEDQEPVLLDAVLRAMAAHQTPPRRQEVTPENPR